MATWRCPHCGTPQPESSRCWVCAQSSTTCATCRWFRRGIGGRLGYCALDSGHAPLRGAELRPCWTGAESAGDALTLFAVGARGRAD